MAIQNPAWSLKYYAHDGVTQEFPGAQTWMKFQIDNVTVSGDVINIPSGINKSANVASVKIYNSHDVVYVNSRNDASSITIYDLSGRKVKTAFNAKMVSISSLSRGIYIVSARMADGKAETERLLNNSGQLEVVL